MVLNKRGMFFTIMIILLLSVFVVSYNFYFIIQDKDVVTQRVDTMQNFVFSVEENLERELYAFGFRTIFLAEERITATGDYITDLESFVEEAFFYGTFAGENSTILEGVNYNDLVDKTKQRGDQINVDVNFDNPNISISQEDPWHVVFTIEFDFNATDEAGQASWNRRQEIKSYVDISGFEDPLYLLNTNGKVTNVVNGTIYSFPDGAFNLLSHCQGGYYTASTTGPSFLDRLAGSTAANVNGIESLVYLPDISAQGIATKEKSVVDHIYFSSSNPSYQAVFGMPSWFRLDDAHVAVYVS